MKYANSYQEAFLQCSTKPWNTTSTEEQRASAVQRWQNMRSIPRKREQGRKMLGSSGKSVKKKEAIKGPAVILGSGHTGSALVKALGNQGPINLNGWHGVQNNKYFSQQSVSCKVCEGTYAKYTHGSQNGMEICCLRILLFIWGFSKICRDIFHNKTFTVQFTVQYFPLRSHFTTGLPLTYFSTTWEAQ